MFIAFRMNCYEQPGLHGLICRLLHIETEERTYCTEARGGRERLRMVRFEGCLLSFIIKKVSPQYVYLTMCVAD